MGASIWHGTRLPALPCNPWLNHAFGDKVFNTVIPRNVRLAEAPSHGVPGVVFDPSSKGAQAYIDFATEMVERVVTLPSAATL